MKLKLNLNPFTWFKRDSLEPAIKLVLRVAGIASDVWTIAKEHVRKIEGSGKSGPEKHAWVVKALLALFPSIGPAWAGAIVQLAWLVLERTVFKPEAETPAATGEESV